MQGSYFVNTFLCLDSNDGTEPVGGELQFELWGCTPVYPSLFAAWPKGLKFEKEQSKGDRI